MRKLIVGPLSLAAVLVATPVTASPAFIVVAAALAAGVGVSASQQPYETWQYTAKYGWVGGARADVSSVEQPLAPRSGTSQSIVRTCRDALMRRAQPYDLASMEVVGRMARSSVFDSGAIVDSRSAMACANGAASPSYSTAVALTHAIPPRLAIESTITSR